MDVHACVRMAGGPRKRERERETEERKKRVINVLVVSGEVG